MLASSSRIVASSSPGASIVWASVAPSVSSAHPTESSICLVECGSVKQRPKKNSR